MAEGIPVCRRSALVCVAIQAAVSAGVICADVNALKTTAGGPLVFVPCAGQAAARDLLDARPADALSVRNAVCAQIDLFRAGFHAKSVPVRDVFQSGRKGNHIFAQQPGSAQSVHLGVYFFVPVKKRDDDGVGILRKPFCHSFKRAQMPLGRAARADEDGVIPPDDPLSAELLRKLLKSGDQDIRLIRQVLLDIMPVSGQGKLKIVRKGRKLMKPLHHRERIFCPKNNTVHDLRGNRDPAYLTGV